jgi:hypothetical protein
MGAEHRPFNNKPGHRPEKYLMFNILRVSHRNRDQEVNRDIPLRLKEDKIASAVPDRDKDEQRKQVHSFHP